MPRKVDLKQNSKEWSAWRNKGLGASDSGAILGVSEWQTPFELWAEKTGLLKKPEFNSFAKAAVEKGQRLEPEARSFFEKQLGLLFPAITYEHSDYPFIRASLDGHNETINVSLELKCPGVTSFLKAKKGEIPDNYFSQMQMQMLVSEAKLTHYGVYYKKDEQSEPETVLMNVEADPDYQARLLGELIKFWNCVDKKIPPPVNATDLARLVERMKKEFEKFQASMQALNILNQAFTSNHFSI